MVSDTLTAKVMERMIEEGGGGVRGGGDYQDDVDREGETGGREGGGCGGDDSEWTVRQVQTPAPVEVI